LTAIISLLSEKYKNGSMNFIKALWVGFKSNQFAKAKRNIPLIFMLLRIKKLLKNLALAQFKVILIIITTVQ
jgi:hypothetical protein